MNWSSSHDPIKAVGSTSRLPPVHIAAASVRTGRACRSGCAPILAAEMLHLHQLERRPGIADEFKVAVSALVRNAVLHVRIELEEHVTLGTA